MTRWDWVISILQMRKLRPRRESSSFKVMHQVSGKSKRQTWAMRLCPHSQPWLWASAFSPGLDSYLLWGHPSTQGESKQMWYRPSGSLWARGRTLGPAADSHCTRSHLPHSPPCRCSSHLEGRNTESPTGEAGVLATPSHTGRLAGPAEDGLAAVWPGIWSEVGAITFHPVAEDIPHLALVVSWPVVHYPNDPRATVLGGIGGGVGYSSTV